MKWASGLEAFFYIFFFIFRAEKSRHSMNEKISAAVCHPVLYEMNIRTFLHRISTQKKKATIQNIPPEYWDYLASSGIDYVWLMGIWNTLEGGFDRNIFSEEDLSFYKSVLPDLEEKDIAGSPYAIDDYFPLPVLGLHPHLKKIRKKLKDRNIRLIVDFVPNHYGMHSSLLEKNPSLFLRGSQDHINAHPHLFFKSGNEDGLIFAHGKDPYFSPWRDTVQVNYSKKEARVHMIHQLLELAKICDGVRCDMIMLAVKRIFIQTWGPFLEHKDLEEWSTEFWPEAIKTVKAKFPDFIFIGECYWGMEGEMQQQGFDYTYDKSLHDKLSHGESWKIKTHNGYDLKYESRTVRFLENHDEERALSVFDSEKNRAAAVLTSTSPGMKLFHQGQWEGKRIRVPVQLGRDPVEPPCSCAIRPFIRITKEETHPALSAVAKAKLNRVNEPEIGQPRSLIEPVCKCTFIFYRQLLTILQHNVFKYGSWRSLDIGPSPGSPERHHDIIGFRWNFERSFIYVLVNYSGSHAYGVFWPTVNSKGRIKMKNLLNKQIFKIDPSSDGTGICLDLPPYKSLILEQISVK
jgi:hypothetical protein